MRVRIPYLPCRATDPERNDTREGFCDVQRAQLPEQKICSWCVGRLLNSRCQIDLDVAFDSLQDFSFIPFAVPGKVALFLEGNQLQLGEAGDVMRALTFKAEILRTSLQAQS